MLWACFGANGIGDITIIEGTMDKYVYRDILNNHLRSSAKKIGMKRGWTFLHDNDPKHTSNIVKSELQKMKIKVVNHPPQSPDMNPIENLWDYVDRRITIADRATVDTLIQAIKREWSRIPRDYCMKLIMSMPKRIDELYRFNGRATHY